MESKPKNKKNFFRHNSNGRYDPEMSGIERVLK